MWIRSKKKKRTSLNKKNQFIEVFMKIKNSFNALGYFFMIVYTYTNEGN